MFANRFLWACWPLWFRRFCSFSFFAMTYHNTYSLCVGLCIVLYSIMQHVASGGGALFKLGGLNHD